MVRVEPQHLPETLRFLLQVIGYVGQVPPRCQVVRRFAHHCRENTTGLTAVAKFCRMKPLLCPLVVHSAKHMRSAPDSPIMPLILRSVSLPRHSAAWYTP